VRCLVTYQTRVIVNCCSPGYKKTVPGEGMPYANEPGKKGDLVIEFSVDFPHLLTPEKRALIRKALPK